MILLSSTEPDTASCYHKAHTEHTEEGKELQNLRLEREYKDDPHIINRQYRRSQHNVITLQATAVAAAILNWVKGPTTLYITILWSFAPQRHHVVDPTQRPFWIGLKSIQFQLYTCAIQENLV